MAEKPFSPACDRNRDPILAVLRRHFADRRHVLEIGSGTGQHAVHFAAAMPWLTWQCSDRAEQLPGIRMWLDEAALPNTPAPVELDVASFDSFRPPRIPGASPGQALRLSKDGSDPETSGFRAVDAVFSANTLHIMGWPEVESLFAGLGKVLAEAATAVVYGPFNAGGRFTSDSNRAFDASLKARDPRMGIRDAEAVDVLAQRIGLRRVDDAAMPANNRCLVWRRTKL